MARSAERQDPLRQCRAIVPAQLNRGVPWVLEHRCMHPAGPSGYCWQHEPVEHPDEGAGAGEDWHTGHA